MESGLEYSEYESDSGAEAQSITSETLDGVNLPIRLNRAIILQGISRVHIDKRDMVELDKQFYKVTHLHLQNKGIDVLDSLHLFHNLTVLYLYENNIVRIEGLENACHLELLYLQKNKLDRINGLLECKQLRKLFLGYNEISVVEGLEGLVCLEELHVEYQRLEDGEQLTFDPSTLDVLSKHLQLLNISGNGIKSLEDFAGMEELRILQSRDNAVSDLDNTSLIISTLKRLRELDLRENPITKYHKYKEKLIGFGDCLELLDNKEVTGRTRQFIKSFCQMKAKNLQRMVSSLGGSPNMMPSNPLTPSGSGVMPQQFISPPSQASMPKFKFAPPAGMPRNQQKHVEHILKRLYPKTPRVDNSRPNTDLQSRANQLLKASGNKLIKPQEISIPQFVLASSNTLKADLGLMTDGEVEEARAVTRGGTPVTAGSDFDLGIEERNVAAFRAGVQSAGELQTGNWEQPTRLTDSEIQRQTAEKIFVESLDSATRVSEMNRHLFGPTKGKRSTKVKAKKAQPSQPKIVEPLRATYSVTIPTSPDALRLSQIKSPPNMMNFGPSQTGSKMETGIMTPLSLRGQKPKPSAPNFTMRTPTPPQGDPFEDWDSLGMVLGKHGVRPIDQPEWTPEMNEGEPRQNTAHSASRMEWPPVGISKDHGLWLAQQEGLPLEYFDRDRALGNLSNHPSGAQYSESRPQALTQAQQEALANFQAYQRQFEAQNRQMANQQQYRGYSLPNFSSGQQLSWLHQQYIQGSGNPLFLPVPSVAPVQAPQATKKKSGKVEAAPSEPIQPYMTQVYELPPWPHILRNLGAKDPKVTYMP